ncbi:MAG: efflux RND transporter periplasmic adaptor subunit [Gammaproteobacteria bacterium]|nr:efflux RND transporter periplasmic adaptor subunit [Gammaproteobacteria bacterium]
MNKSLITFTLFIFVLGLGIGYWMSTPNQDDRIKVAEPEPIFYRSPMDPTVTSVIPAKDTMGMKYIPVYTKQENRVEREVLFYRNPMNPEITSPIPAKDSMGMDYVPVYANRQSTVEPVGTVRIDPVVVQNIGVRTSTVERKSFARTVRVPGRIDVNEERIMRLHPKVEGWVEEIFIDKSGQMVAEDDILLGIYSRKLVATQEEYILALAGQEALTEFTIPEVRRGAEQLVESSKTRLEFFDVPGHQIHELEESKKVKKSLHIHSPVAGTVINVGVRRGQYVTPGTELYQITDLSDVWVYAEVYDYELPWIKEGDEVEMALASLPGEIFVGVLSYIYPYAEAKTRTTKVRIVFDNVNLKLRPEMLADVKIHADLQHDVLVIPAEAVVRSSDETQVFVDRGEGKYEPRTVRLGVSSGNQVVVLSGLEQSEKVVTSAQFLIDSESKLNEAVSKMLTVGKAAKSTNTGAEPAETGRHSHD